MMDFSGRLVALLFCLSYSSLHGFVKGDCPSPTINVDSRSVNITSSTYTLVCSPGHAFSDGSTQVQFICTDQTWIPVNRALGNNPRCYATCKPVCQNGGRCIATQNVCDCPPEFRGKNCEYQASVCDISKLGLTNQISSCGSSDETLSCIIYCPDGFEFESKPADTYTCSYKQGKYSGTPPRCIQQCKNGSKYMKCAPNGQPNCLGQDTLKKTSVCVENCYCPEGTFHENDKCLPQNQCPCIKDGVPIPVGESINVECNTCTCKAGQKLECTKKECGATCSAIGDPHYTNFNGIRFDYMGKCSYYLLVTDSFTIEGENVGWSGNFLEKTVPNYGNYASCTKSVTVRTLDYNITIGQKMVVTLNNKVIVDLPVDLGFLKVKRVSSTVTAIEFTNGVTVQFDGVYSLYVYVPYAYKGKTKGLCGTFGGSDTEAMKNIGKYAEHFNTDLQCDSGTGNEKHPCDVYPDRKPEAERLCGAIKGPIFASCKVAVPPETAFANCLYDVCANGKNPTEIFCGDLSNYAKQCAAKGAIIDWRNQVAECAIACPPGQVYKICHNACKRTCGDITANLDCQNQCTEGCNCPDGQALDQFERCIPIAECPCTFDGWKFSKGFRRRDGKLVCVCDGGVWKCKEEPPEIVKTLPNCEAALNLTLRDFIPAFTKTCKNMHEVSAILTGSTCICKEGKVFGSNGVCIPMEECPCYYAGRSYAEETVVKRHCEDCKCTKNRWVCEQQPCLGQCTVWGQGHYQTFDSTSFDFQGICEYIVSAGSRPGGSYQITTKYTKQSNSVFLQTITIRTTVKERVETLILRRDQSIYPLQRYQDLIVFDSVALVDIESPALGLRVQWDRGNTLYVKVENYWRKNVRGICGDYDGGNDVTDVNPLWHTGDGCIETTTPHQDCSFGRMQEALLKCRILKSDLFKTCNFVVDPESYMTKCINDLCSICESAEDNGALCTALSAYSQECINQGVLINWRSNELCPLQCGPNENLEYGSRCPLTSCEDVTYNRRLCGLDTDCEACIAAEKCPSKFVFASRWNRKCVNQSDCKEVCLRLKGVTYYEGDIMDNFAGKVCKCVKGLKVCG